MFAWIGARRSLRTVAHAVSVYTVDRVNLPVLLTERPRLTQDLVFDVWFPLNVA